MRPCRVLLAEDNQEDQAYMVQLLGTTRADVTTVEHGARAVEIALQAQAEGQPFDVILMDIYICTKVGKVA